MTFTTLSSFTIHNSEFSPRPPILITGAAAITCLGLTRHETWQNILSNKCGIAPLTQLESPTPNNNDGGQVPPLPAGSDQTPSRESQYLRRAILDALTDANLPTSSLPYSPDRVGLLLGTTLHGMREAGKFLRTGDFNHLREFSANAVTARATHDLPIAGLTATTCSACSSSLGAIALACTLLETHQLDLVIAGGYDPISDYAYAGFNSLRLVAQGPLRPFARDRQGMKVSEGYGIVILERADDAAKRGARALAQIRGYGESADAHHLTQPHPEGDGAARAIQAALKSANLSPKDIDLIAAHATGTPDNDAAEYAAFSRTFTDQLPRIPVVAFKSHLGHTLGGAGAIELILSATALHSQTLPTTTNVQKSDTDFPHLNLSTGTPRPSQIRATLNTSLGFGGANTCIILTHPPTAPSSGAPGSVRASSAFSPSPGTPGEGRGEGSAKHALPTHNTTASSSPLSSFIIQNSAFSLRPVFITGIGILLPGIIGSPALLSALSSSPIWPRATAPIDESSYLHLLNARRVRRMSTYVKLTLAATALALQDANISDPTAFAANCSAILGTLHGSSDYCHQYYGQIVQQGLIGANPMLFAEGVPNAAAAHLSLMLSLKGACQTIIGTRTAALDALRLASLRISAGHWDRAIVSAGEESYPTVDAAYRHSGLHAPSPELASPPFNGQHGFLTGAGAVTLILESEDSLAQRNATKSHARILAANSTRATAPDRSDLPTRIRDLLSSLPNPTAPTLSSANGTWIDHAELAAIRSLSPTTPVSTLYGHTPELFATTPLASLAATLLTGHLPPLVGAPQSPGCTSEASTPTPDPPLSTFTTLATDYTALTTAIHLERTP